MTTLEAIAILQLEVDGPVGVSISYDGGDSWPTFRFDKMAHPHIERICAEVAVALEVIIRAAKNCELGG